MDAALQRAATSSPDGVERARMAALISTLSDAVLVVDTAGQFVHANPSFEGLFGPHAEAFVDGDPGPDSVRMRAARGECFNSEIELRAVGGSRWFDARTAPVLTADGVVHGGVVVLADRTDRRLLRLHEEFMALASHELRSPLTALGGFFEMLSRRLAPEMDERTTQHLVRAQGQVRRLIDLVSELTDLARLHGDKLSLKPERCELTALLAQFVDAAETLSVAHRVGLQVPEGQVWVMADAQRLDQVLMNLVTNAVKHAPDCKRIDVRLEVTESCAVVCVQDYGPGVADGDRERIFQRYYQARATSGPSRAGLGLGLHIAREIMLAHGGGLELTASSPDGSIFSARLPLSR